VGSHHIFITINFLLFTLVVGFGFSEKTRAMIVDVRVEIMLVEGIDLSRPFLWNMLVSKRFAHNRSVFTLGQGIVV
jgi:hypothetical protein